MTDLALADERDRQIYSHILLDPNAKCLPRGSQELGWCYHGDMRTSQREVISSLEGFHIEVQLGTPIQLNYLYRTAPYRVDMESLLSWRSWHVLNWTDSRFF